MYLIKDKFEAFYWFQQFHKFIQNVFQSNINVLRIDNGRELLVIDSNAIGVNVQVYTTSNKVTSNQDRLYTD